jgi:phenylacetate-CoA ligase
MIFNPEIETAAPEKLKEIQSGHLVKLVNRVYDNVKFYKDKFDELGIKPSDIKTIDDITKLPFTQKEDLRANYPFGMFAKPLNEVLEIHASSGTTGNPTVVGYTENDIKLWGTVMARTIAVAGGEPGDVIQNAYGYGLFTGGLGVHYGALELKCSIVPTSSGVTKRQIKLLGDFGARIITCTPSYALYMAETAEEMGVNVKKLPLEIGILGAEPWTHDLRKEIEKAWNMKALDIYGLSEIIGPGVAQECPAQDGLHLFADVFYPEIINPETLEPVKPGEDGELVITTLTKEAIPLIRYRTKDITSINYDKCKKCGRTLPRIAKLKGRTDDMLIIRGVNVYPSQIEEILLRIEETEPHYQLVVERAGALDQLEVHVEINDKVFSDEIKKLEILEQKIAKEIESNIGLFAKIKLVEPKSIERSMGKAVRVIDKRKQ